MLCERSGREDHPFGKHLLITGTPDQANRFRRAGRSTQWLRCARTVIYCGCRSPWTPPKAKRRPKNLCLVASILAVSSNKPSTNLVGVESASISTASRGASGSVCHVQLHASCGFPMDASSELVD
jgi:hypothetical protein